MKKIILYLLVMCACSACATAQVKTVTQDGKQCEATYATLFLTSDAETISACGGKAGTTNKAVNTALLEALLKALIAVP